MSGCSTIEQRGLGRFCTKDIVMQQPTTVMVVHHEWMLYHSSRCYVSVLKTLCAQTPEHDRDGAP